jgi:hypothetical protein
VILFGSLPDIGAAQTDDSDPATSATINSPLPR